MAQLFSNNASGLLNASITNVATSVTLVSGAGSKFPAVVAPDFMLATLVEGTTVEIVKITAHTAASDTFTIARNVELIANANPGASAFTAAATMSARLTSGAFDGIRTEHTSALIAGSSAPPIVPVAGKASLWFQQWAGRPIPVWDGNGIADPTRIQSGLYGNQVVLWKPGSSTTKGVMIGGVSTEGGTLSHPALATTNFRTMMRHSLWANVVTTASQFLGMRMNDVSVWRGNAAGLGGFFFFARFAFPKFPAGTRVFVGLASLTTGVQVTADPSGAAESHIGIAMDIADTNLTIMAKNATTNTKNAIGAGLARTANEVYDLIMFAKPNDSLIGVYLDKYASAGGARSNLLDTTYTTNIPLSTAFLAPVAAMSNGTANTTVDTVEFALMSLYVESDF